MDIRELEPRPVWEHFSSICAVPHPSHGEEALAAALEAWARARGFAYARDAAGNLVVRKPASPGAANAPGVVLQGHLDMVPQAAAGSAHDFSRDPIRAGLDPADPAWVKADGTTLGADNGIGLAMGMALFEEPGFRHGPLELLCTANEEDGMSGAKGLDPSLVNGRILVNIDSEDDDELTIGCAGSIRSLAKLSASAEPAPAGLTWLRVSLGGLLGGHSGMDIDKGRANACMSLAAALSGVAEAGLPFRLAVMEGGSASNAIPRDAYALIGVEDEAAARKALGLAGAALKERFAAAEPKLELAVAASAAPAYALTAAASAEFCRLVGSLPDGLFAMEPDIPGLIRSSSNLGILRATAADGAFRAEITTMVRSSSDEEKERYASAIETAFDAAAAKGWGLERARVSISPAWEPDPSSALLAKAKAAFKAMRGFEPKVKSTHGGLECGVFRPLFPDMAMISVGPTIRYPHSPDERVNVASVARAYEFLKSLVRVD